jgi:hypothetical protein
MFYSGREVKEEIRMVANHQRVQNASNATYFLESDMRDLTIVALPSPRRQSMRHLLYVCWLLPSGNFHPVVVTSGV